MVSLVNSRTNATSKRWHLWEIDLEIAPGLPPGWILKRELRNLEPETRNKPQNLTSLTLKSSTARSPRNSNPEIRDHKSEN